MSSHTTVQAVPHTAVPQPFGSADALAPYLLMVDDDEQGKADYVSLDSYRYEDPQPIPASTGIRTMQDDVPGYTIRGTLKTIGNAEAAELAHTCYSFFK